MKRQITVSASLKFILGTLLGLFLVVIPLTFGSGADVKIDTVSFFYLKKLVALGGTNLQIALTWLMSASTILAIVDTISKPKFIQENKVMRTLFSCSTFDLVNRVLGSIMLILVVYKIGPVYITSPDTGGAMLGLVTLLAIIIPPMLLFQTLILELGLMEFLGTLIGFVVKPLFKVSKMTAVSLISAWVGPGNAAIMGARQLFDEGYYTVKEAAVIGATFSTSSIGWCVFVASKLGLMEHFGAFYLVITLVGIIVALVSVRIPPISKYQDMYKNGQLKVEDKEEEKTGAFNVKLALELACERSEKVKAENFTNKIKNMLFYAFALQPIIMCWGTLALILSTYTPVLKWLSYPIVVVLGALNLPEATTAAPAIISGFADNFLPIILGMGIASLQVKFIVGTMSILQLIFMSEIGVLLTSTKVITKFVDIVLIFIQRTIISLFFVILLSYLIF